MKQIKIGCETCYIWGAELVKYGVPRKLHMGCHVIECETSYNMSWSILNMGCKGS